MIRVTAFAWVPPFAEGLVRDLRVRWALEEAGEAYETRLLPQGEQNSEAWREMQPFGQIPLYEEDGLVLFESGAIVQHIAARSPALMPADPADRARTIQWMYAAMNSVEPQVQGLAAIDLFYANEDWAKARRPGQETLTTSRLSGVARSLRGRDYLVADRFTAADLLMTTVLRILRHTDLVSRDPVLAGYVARCEARPAFRKALADQVEPFARNAPAAA